MYKFKPGQFSGDAAATFEALEKVRAANGGQLTAHAVVEAAAGDLALHHHFEWDDIKAAHEHRLNTARRLIRAIVYSPPKREPVPVFVNVRSDDDERYYQKISVLTTDEYTSAYDFLKASVVRQEKALVALERCANTKAQKKHVTAIKVAYDRYAASLAPPAA
jgi:hypothetical protein